MVTTREGRYQNTTRGIKYDLYQLGKEGIIIKLVKKWDLVVS